MTVNSTLETVVSYQSLYQLIGSFLGRDLGGLDVLLPETIEGYAHLMPFEEWEPDWFEINPWIIPGYQEQCQYCLAYFGVDQNCNCEN